MTDESPVRSPREVRREQPHLLDYVRIVFRRKLVALVVFLTVVIGAGAYLYSVTPIYETQARVLIEMPTPDSRESLDVSEAQQAYYQTHIQLLQSRDLARQDDHGTRSLEPPGPESVAAAVVVGRHRARMVAGRHVGHQRRSAPIAHRPHGRDSFSRPRGQPVTRSGHGQPGPEQPSGRTANPVAGSRAGAQPHQRHGDDLHRRHPGYQARDVARELEVARRADRRSNASRSRRAEAALQSYRERIGALSLQDGQSIVVQKLGDLNGAVTRAKTERLQKEAVYRQASTEWGDSPARSTGIPAIMTNTFVQQQRNALADLQRQQAELGEKLGDRHPEMIKLNLAVQKVQAGLRAATVGRRRVAASRLRVSPVAGK